MSCYGQQYCFHPTLYSNRKHFYWTEVISTNASCQSIVLKTAIILGEDTVSELGFNRFSLILCNYSFSLNWYEISLFSY